MFNQLSERFSQVVSRIRGYSRLTEENIQEALQEVRYALLEGDVALPVVESFIEHVKQRAVGQEVINNVQPGYAFIKIVYDELVALMGPENSALDLAAQPPVVILMAGLQGAGKTTTTAKLARWLKEEQHKNVMVVSTDVYRPAAIEQLRVLAEQVDVKYFAADPHSKPQTIAEQALNAARKQVVDVLLVDTAGRLHIDDAMMDEIKSLHKLLRPVETLFVVDSQTGQDAANTAKAFNEALSLSGVVLTKTDGDARGGAALSVKYLTGKPIKFVGVGEKIDALSPFYPDRIASRILDMGDIVSLVEQAERKIDKEKAEKLAKKIIKGKGFDLEDFLQQLEQLDKMGGLMSIMGNLPGFNAIPAALKGQVNDNSFKHIRALIQSMTLKERRFPHIINGSRKRRIAQGAGRPIQEVNQVLRMHEKMGKMMKKMSNPGFMKNMMGKFSHLMPNQ